MLLTRVVAARVTSDPCPGSCGLRDITELALAAGQGSLPGLASGCCAACEHRNQAHSRALLVGILLKAPQVQPRWLQLVFPTKHTSAKTLPPCPALCQPLSRVPGLTEVVEPCRRHQNAGEGVLGFCLSCRPGQKLRAAPSF